MYAYPSGALDRDTAYNEKLKFCRNLGLKTRVQRNTMEAKAKIRHMVATIVLD